MTDGDHLLRAILLQPQEDTPRLAYADYLEETADGKPQREQAEFIRLSIELEQYTRYSKAWKPAAARISEIVKVNLEGKKRLWPEYDKFVYRWDQGRGVQVDGIRGSNGGPRGGRIRIRRGFPYWLALDVMQFHQDAASWFCRFPITTVHIWDREPESHLEANGVWERGFVSSRPDTIPAAIFDLLTEGIEHERNAEFDMPTYRDYWAGEHEAREDLMRACVRYGRKRVKLPHDRSNCYVGL